jgi:hypothetical protein
MAAVWKLLILIAVLLMPFGMTAPAAPHRMTAATMPIGHCPDQDSNHGMKAGFHECTMACAAALPAADLVASEPLTIVCQRIAPPAAERLHGLHPETATPPPKRS